MMQLRELTAHLGLVVDNAAFDRFERRLNVGLNLMQGLHGVLARVGMEIGAAFSAEKIVTTASDLEQLSIQLAGVEKSAAAGEKAFQFLSDAAQQSPYDLQQVSNAFILLRNSGADAYKMLPPLINAAARFTRGSDGLQRVVMQVSQALGKGKVQASDFNILAEDGIPAWQLLAQAMGKTVAQVRALSEKGKLGGDAIQGFLTELGKASEGASAEKMNSMLGSWSNVGDNLIRGVDTLRRAGVFDFIKQGIDGLNVQLTRLREDGTLQRWAVNLKQGVEALRPAVVALGGALVFVIDNLDKARPILEGFFIYFAATRIASILGVAFALGENLVLALSLATQSFYAGSVAAGIFDLAVAALPTLIAITVGFLLWFSIEFERWSNGQQSHLDKLLDKWARLRDIIRDVKDIALSDDPAKDEAASKDLKRAWNGDPRPVGSSVFGEDGNFTDGSSSTFGRLASSFGSGGLFAPENLKMIAGLANGHQQFLDSQASRAISGWNFQNAGAPAVAGPTVYFQPQYNVALPPGAAKDDLERMMRNVAQESQAEMWGNIHANTLGGEH